ncbi:MAG: UDP-N-acetylenolpyruvoylglucosamine reductase [Candidatus Schekmanbacteria bacterium RBG_13_48_7]|uniref:UDP-N-acetylenolpyruvoylglucosamine reductase n=1 Tax=Candidatus Schekmanbacteria bacterium RBG_13_48_7 TaxID=1817878 RepID=A0A1F7RWW5_9BACT|nr:MAG: UDP-N-acetylenolpyruvoylglucosamine reductase [Candidatus Schekmanbacteria bacterium RBG_13_48_7]
MSLYNELCTQINGRWRKNVPMKNYTTMRVGGPADLLISPESIEEVSMLISWLTKNSVYHLVLGAGSNLIVRDGGIRGVVISTRDSFNYFRIHEHTIVTGAGTSIATLSAVALRAELSGLEFAGGIPGTIGGAVKINAGAFDCSISDVLQEVKIVDRMGIIRTKKKEELSNRYRESCINESDMIVEAELTLIPEKKEEINKKVLLFTNWRKSHQPMKLASAGCVFKNPHGMHAGKLIDDLGLKGLRYGDAAVSDVHANFIVNHGSAKASDILMLMDKVREKVMNETGIDLIPEVIVVGEDTNA